jgi:hypothetical protein
VDGIVNATVDNNTVKADGAATGAAVCTGIAMWDESQGTIAGNTITAKCPHANYSRGLSVNESDNVTVNNNTITGTPGVGIEVQSTCYASPNASNDQITNNTVKSPSGIDVGAYGTASSTCGAVVDSHTVQSNTFTHSGPRGTNGVSITISCSGSSYPCQADSNVVEDNGILGFSTAISNQGTNTVISGNH